MTGASSEAAPVQRSRGASAPRKDASVAGLGGRKAGKAAAAATAGETGRPVGRFARRGRNYGRTILWTLRDTFAAEPRRFALALLLGGLSLAAQALAVLVVYGYSQAIQQDARLIVPFAGIDWSARTEVPFLLAVVAGFAASLSAAALLNFLSQGLLLGSVRRSLARAIERLARAVNALPDPRAPIASRLAVDMGFSRLDSGLAACARSAFLIVQTIPALVGAVIAGGVLVWMEPVLTLGLVLVAAAWTGLLYPVALRMARFGRALRRTGAVVRRDFPSVPANPANWASADQVAGAYTGWLRARVEIVAVVGVGIALIVAIAIYVMGAEMMSGEQEWPVLIAYVGALQLALNGAFRMVRVVAIVSRHYPEMVRNRLLVDDLPGLARPTRPLGSGQVITLGRSAGGDPITATVGDWLAVVSEEPIQRVQLAALGARDAEGGVVPSGRLMRGGPRPATTDVPIVVVDGRILNEGSRASDAALADRLVVVVHVSTTTVGGFGETRLFLIEDDEIVAAVDIGSEEASTALNRVARRAAKARKDRPNYALDDVDVE